MILVGLDDTDVLDSPGTNKLARRLAALIGDRYQARLITRHQLLQDPRVPCTRKNGCAAIALEPLTGEPVEALFADLRRAVIEWAAEGSDPGLCVATSVPEEIVEFGRKCQREIVTQGEARLLARQAGMRLEGLGGTEDGVIGAVAALGLATTGDDGRVVYRGDCKKDTFDIGAVCAIDAVLAAGVDEIRHHETGEAVSVGSIDLGKRLRPNLRAGKVVLFVAPHVAPDRRLCEWMAVREL